MEKEIKIEIPEGYEIDKEKSTFEKIVFKKKEKIINCIKDIECINGVFINLYSGLSDCVDSPNHPIHYNVFLNEKYAKSALALAQISQLLPYYDSKVDWTISSYKYCICRYKNRIITSVLQSAFEFLAFNTEVEAKRFLKHNEQLIKDYFMVD